jgi:hypothetical protein
MAKFMRTAGYATTHIAGFTNPSGWICEQCYHDFKELLLLRTSLP